MVPAFSRHNLTATGKERLPIVDVRAQLGTVMCMTEKKNDPNVSDPQNENTQATHTHSVAPARQRGDDERVESGRTGLSQGWFKSANLIIGVGLIAVIAGGFVTTNNTMHANTLTIVASLSTLETQLAQGGGPTSGGATEQVVLGAPVPFMETQGLINDTGAVIIGDGSGEIVEVFVDYQCPYCKNFEESLGEKIMASANAGAGHTVVLNTMAFLGEDGQTPGASSRAANAAMCVAAYGDSEQFLAVNTGLFLAAVESQNAFPAEEIQGILTTAGVSEQVLACSESGEFNDSVRTLTQNSFGRGVNGTPNVAINGINVGNPFESAELTELAAR
jgi:protein-disulfide isomerase